MDQALLKEVMVDIRQSQRLLVAFYKRVMPLIKDISELLECDNFFYWSPSRFARPTKQVQPPVGVGKWEWDMMPMADAYFAFTSEPVAKNKIISDDSWVLVIRLVTDSGTDAFDNNRKNLDPLNFDDVEQCDTRLELYAYKFPCGFELYGEHWSLQRENKYPAPDGQLVGLKEKISAFGWLVNLETITNSDSVEPALAEFRQLLIQHQFKAE